MKKTISAVLALIMTLSLVIVGIPVAWADPPAQDGKVFAGYYTDSTYTTPANEATEFAKFVDKDVLTVKFQLVAGVNESDETTGLRAVTTVDSTNYRAVGFFLSVDGGEEKTLTATKVARRIIGKDGLATLTYEPSVFSDESQYFCAFNFTVANTAFNKALSFTPYWVTMDGTTVRGEERTVRIVESSEFSHKAQVTGAEVIGTWVYDRVTTGASASLAPPNAYDGDRVTAWQPQANSSAYEDGEGIIFTLDRAYELTAIQLVAKLKLLWLDIYTSPDGQNWTAQPIFSLTNENRGLWITDGDYRVCTLTGLTSANTGYVKIEFKGNNTTTATMFLNEVEFYGKLAPAAGSYEPTELTVSNAEIVGTWLGRNDANLNKTYDGNTTNMWNPQATAKYASGEGVVFSLDKTYDLADSATLIFGSRRYYFDLLTSSDGRNYTLARSVSSENADDFYTDDTENKIYTCTLNGLNAADVRSVKVLFTGDATNSTWIAFREVTLSGKAPAAEPEIVKAAVTSGTPLGTWKMDRVGSASVGPEKAYDSDATGTCWNPQAVDTTYTSGEGIVFALDRVYDITKISFVYNRKHYFQISVSENGTDYTVIATINADNAATYFSELTSNRVSCDVNTNVASIQYVKLAFTGNEANNGFVGLFDFAVSGSISD